MKKNVRTLDPKTQEVVRLRRIKMPQKGRIQQSVAKKLEFSQSLANGWWRRFQEGDREALRAQKRGPKRKAASSLLSGRRKCSGSSPTGPRPLNHKLPSSLRTEGTGAKRSVGW